MIARLLDLPPMSPDRFRLFLKVAVSLSSTFAFVIIAYLGGTTVFLSQCDPRHLPVAFMIGYLLTMGLTWVVRQFRTTSPDKILHIFFTTYSLLFILISRGLAEPGPWSSATALAICLPLPTLSWMIYWNVVQKFVDIGEMKTWTPTLNSLGLLVQVACSFALGWLTQHLGIGNLFLVAGAWLLLAWGVVAMIDEGPVNVAKGDAGAADEPPSEGSRRLVLYLAWISVLFAIGKFATEFQLNCAARARFADPAQLAGFLGRIESFSKLLLVFTQAFLMKRLMSRLSPATVHAILPASLVLLALAAIMAGVDSSIPAFVVFTALGKGSFPTFINVSLAALPPAQAREARLRLDGIWYAAGAVSISLICWAFPSLLTPTRCALLIGTVASVHLLACLWVDPAYISALGSGVTRRRVEDPGAPGALAVEAEPASETARDLLGRLRRIGDRDAARSTLNELAGMLGSPEAPRRREGCWIVRQLGHPVLLEDLLPLLSDEDRTVRSEVLQGLEGVWQPSILTRLEERATNDEDAGIREHAGRIAQRIRNQEMPRILAGLAQLSRSEREHLRERVDVSDERVRHLLTALGRMPDAAARHALALAGDHAARSGLLPSLTAALDESRGGSDVTRITHFVEELVGRPPGPTALDLAGHLWPVLPRDEASRICKQVVTTHLSVDASNDPDLEQRSLRRAARLLGLLAADPAVEEGLVTLRASPSRQHVSMVKELLQMSFPDASLQPLVLELLRRES